MPGMKDYQTTFCRRMILLGKGQVTASPDLAILRLGVKTTGDNVTTAQSENARISQNVIASIKQAGIDEIQTVQYQIDKIYDYVNGEQIDRGYQVTNMIEIRTDQMDLVGSIIDTAVYYGANVVESLRFEVSDQEVYYQKALNLAIKNAIQKAKSITNSLGIFVDPIPVMITENSNVPVPYARTFMSGEISAVTPIESGTTQIIASVTIEFEY